MTLLPRRNLSFCLVFLLLFFTVGQQIDGNLTDNKVLKDIAAPTYVSTGENLVRAILARLGWRNPPAKSSGSFGKVLNSIRDKFKAIYPGTQWCGAGNIAKNPEKVGLFKKTDRCCRAHDHCNVYLLAGNTAYGLRNNGLFTRSHCECDANLYHCLKEIHSPVAINIGFTYFNLLRPQCFKQDYPAHCVKYERRRLKNNKCLNYDYDHRKRRTWQWFDNPDF